MSALEYEKLACFELGLQHPAEAKGVYHNLGTFRIADSDEATRVVARQRLKKVRAYFDRMRAMGDTSDALIREERKYDFHSFGEYLQACKGGKIDPDFATADLKGYRYYLQSKARHAWKLLKREVDALIDDREFHRHAFISGATGSGKSELLKLLIFSLLKNPSAAVVVCDPHSDFAEQLAKWPHGGERLVYIEPLLAQGYTPVLNPFEFTPETADPEQERQVLAQEIVSALRQLVQSKDAHLTANMETILHPCVLVLLNREGSTFKDLQRFMYDGSKREATSPNADLLTLGLQYPRHQTQQFFQNSWHNTHYSSTKAAIATKLQSLLNYSSFEHLTCGKTTFNLEALIEERKFIVFNLGKVDEEVGEAFGRLVVATVQGIARRRVDVAQEKRTPTYLVLDECHQLVSESVSKILVGNGGRKFGLYITLAQADAGYGMSMSLRGLVMNDTNVKMIGQTRGTGNVATGPLVGMNLGDLRELSLGEFFVKAGAGAPFKLKTHTHLLKDSYAISSTEWEARKQEQIKKYYQLLREEPSEEHYNTESVEEW